ncbi:MAG: D-alanyl-D-alanine carboxypeptidase family protein [Rubrobacteraceae bacterium]
MKERPSNLARVTATGILFLALLVLATGTGDTSSAAAQQAGSQAPEGPEIEAEAWSLVDDSSGVLLAGKAPDKRLPVASTAKIMAALVVLEEGPDMQREVAVPEEAEEFVGFTYSNVGLIAGERVSIRDLLVAALVPSGTDAIYTLAYVLGDGSVDNFVEQMNEQAESMGLENTRFDSPAGLDSPDNYSSARDLATMTRAAMEYPEFAEIVALAEPTINTDTREIQLVTTNLLLYNYPEATGVKTGTSPEAGPTLVASAERDGESYIAVILGAREDLYRFEAAEILLAYGFEDFEQAPLLEQDQKIEEMEVPFRPDESVNLVAAKEVVGPEGPGLEIEEEVTTREAPPAARAGQELGTVEVSVNGQRIGQSPLVANRGYEEASFWTKTWYRIQNIFQ